MNDRLVDDVIRSRYDALLRSDHLGAQNKAACTMGYCPPQSISLVQYERENTINTDGLHIWRNIFYEGFSTRG